jgi:hypothetical protein
MMVIAFILSFAMLYLAAALALVQWAETHEEFGRGKFVHCPTTGRQATIVISSVTAAPSSLLAKRILRIRSCTFWPDCRACGRECLGQLQRSP